MNSYDVAYLNDKSKKVIAAVDAYTSQEATRVGCDLLRSHGCKPEILVSCTQIDTRWTADVKHASIVENLIDKMREADTWPQVRALAERLRNKAQDADMIAELEALIDTAISDHLINVIDLWEEGKV